MKKLTAILISVAAVLFISSCSKKSAKTITYTKEKSPMGEKAGPDEIGDIVFTDGTATAWHKGKELTQRQKKNAVAVIFYVGMECSDDNHERVLGVSLVHGSDIQWAEGTKVNAYKEPIESIQCKVTGDEGNYSFEGNLDGSENLIKIKEFLEGKDDTSSKNFSDEYRYPAFHFVETYSEQSRAHVKDTPYKDGWYLPSIAELFKLWEVHENINEAREACDIPTSGYGLQYYWSSSYWSDGVNLPYIFNMETGTLMNYKSSGYDITKSANACAIRDFRTAPPKQYENPVYAPFYQNRKPLFGMYVDSKEGLSVRKEPDQNSEKRYSFKYGDYVRIEELGEEATIDGISSIWVKILLPSREWRTKPNPEEGWVFGGYLTKDSPLSYNEILAIIKEKGSYNADFFPKNDSDGNAYISEYTGWKWADSVYCLDYYYALENYCTENNDHPDVLTIRDALFYVTPMAAETGDLRFIPAGTKLKLLSVIGYGGNQKKLILYPLYSCVIDYKDDEGDAYDVEGIIRGLDITSERLCSTVSDGDGGSMSVIYQRALKTFYLNAPHAGKDGWMAPPKKEIDECLNNYMTYEMAGLKGGYTLLSASYIDNQGKSYNLELETDGWLTLAYPLNMENPVPFLEAGEFHGGMGGGVSSCTLYTIKAENDSVHLSKFMEYEYCDTDGGPAGTGYHYYGKDGVYSYVYEAEERTVQKDEWRFVRQDENDPYNFCYEDNDKNSTWKKSGEPRGKSHILKACDYATPICNLKMHASQNKHSETLFTLKPGTLVMVIAEGKEEKIDGLESNWVLVGIVNDDSFVEGYSSKNDTNGWVFAGYLE